MAAFYSNPAAAAGAAWPAWTPPTAPPTSPPTPPPSPAPLPWTHPPPAPSAAGAIFSVFSTTSLTSTAALTVRGGETCPLLVLTGEQFGQLSELASQGGNINNFYPSDVGSGVKACANVAPVLSPSESYILGVAAWDMPKPTSGEPDPAKAQKQVSMLGSSMAICAAINPCDDAYVFGFDVSTLTYWPGRATG